MTSFEPSIGFPYWYKGPKSIPSEGLATSKHSLHSVVLSSLGTSKSSPGFKEYMEAIFGLKPGPNYASEKSWVFLKSDLICYGFSCFINIDIIWKKNYKNDEFT